MNSELHTIEDDKLSTVTGGSDGSETTLPELCDDVRDMKVKDLAPYYVAYAQANCGMPRPPDSQIEASKRPGHLVLVPGGPSKWALD